MNVLAKTSPLRRFVTSNLAGKPVTRDEFDALAQEIASLRDEIEAMLSPEVLGEAVAEALAPLLDEIDAERGKPVPPKPDGRPAGGKPAPGRVSNSRAVRGFRPPVGG